MKREQLDNHLKERIQVQLFDGTSYTGYLRKTGDKDFENNPNLYIPRNCYVLVNDKLECVSCVFKASHVTMISA